MDSHIYEKGKIEYENGSSGNKVVHIDNTNGADSFFYMGPAGDYRVRTLDDDWGAATADGSPAPHYENKVVVRNDGVEILTLGKDGLKRYATAAKKQRQR